MALGVSGLRVARRQQSRRTDPPPLRTYAGWPQAISPRSPGAVREDPGGPPAHGRARRPPGQVHLGARRVAARRPRTSRNGGGHAGGWRAAPSEGPPWPPYDCNARACGALLVLATTVDEQRALEIRGGPAAP